MATASRRTANFNTLYSTALERWYDAGRVQDTIFEPTPFLWILNQACKETGRWSFDVVVNILESKNAGVDSFQYYDPVSTAPSKGPQSARFPLSNYSGPLSISWQEEVENRDPHRIADRIEVALEQLELTMAERMNVDAYGGNVTNSTNIIGLEQALGATAQSHALGSAADQWQYKQSTNSYGGITRTAWTAPLGVGGTGWEALVADFAAGAGNAFQYTSTGAMDTGLIELNDIYMFASKGIIHPDLGLFSNSPFRDYESAGQQKMQLQNRSDEFRGLQLGYENLMYKSMTIIRDETATTQNATAAIGNETNGSQNAYGLTTKFWKLLVEDDFDFALGPVRGPVDQHSTVRHMVWRGQPVCCNPRHQFRIQDYPA